MVVSVYQTKLALSADNLGCSIEIPVILDTLSLSIDKPIVYQTKLALSTDKLGFSLINQVYRR
jgi:hypothetical protein